MSKKIIFVGPAHPLRGGIASFNERLAKEFVEMGYEVIIYSFSLQYPKFLFPGKTQYTQDPAPKNLAIISKINSINPFNWLKMGWQIRKEKADIYLSRFWLPFIGISLGSIFRILKSKNSKRVAIIDNIIPHEKRVGDFIFSKYFTNSMDHFVAMSKSVRKDLGRFCDAEKVKLIPHPIYDNYGALISKAEAKNNLNLSKHEKIVLFFGFIRDYKGLDLLLKAAAHDKINSENIHFLIAGEYYGNQAYYQKIIADLAIQHKLTLHTHFIPSEDVKNYFCAADIVVQPYKSATQSGITQLAYHFNKPMIVTNVGGLPELVKDGKAGYVVPVDVDSIAQSIYAFYAENKEAEFTNFVVKEKERFSWRVLAQEIESF